MDTTTVRKYTILCPSQSDSTLSIVASWVGIVTFITTTLGGLTIFYTFYKTIVKAQEGTIEYGKAISTSSKELIVDVETMEPMLLRSAQGHRLLDNAMESVTRIRQLASRVDAVIQLRSANSKGIRSIIETYKFGRNTEVMDQVEEIQRMARSLQNMKMNMVLMRLDEQDQILHKIAEALNIKG